MSNYQGSTPIDRNSAFNMIDAIRYTPPVNQTLYGSAAAAGSNSKHSTSSKKDKTSSDKSSIRSTSTFGSTVGLLKGKIRSSSKKESSSSSSSKTGSSSDARKKADQQAKILRNQVTMNG